MANIVHVNRDTNAITLNQETASTLLSLDGSSVLTSSNALSSLSPTFGNVYVPDSGTLGVSGDQTITFNDSFSEIRFDSKYVTIREEDSWNTFELFNYSTNASPNFVILNRARGTESSPVIIQDGDKLGVLAGRAYDGSAFDDCTRIAFEIDGTPGLNDVPGRIVFLTTPDGSATLSERMRIDSAGNVGIGVTSVNEQLEVSGKIRTNNIFNVNGTDGLSGTLTLDDGANWRITLTFTGGILTGQTTAASSAATATWV